MARAATSPGLPHTVKINDKFATPQQKIGDFAQRDSGKVVGNKHAGISGYRLRIFTYSDARGFVSNHP
jgi:hypothetical protein